MNLCLTSKKPVNGKLVFYKPSLFYCIILCAFVQIIFLAVSAFQQISRSTYYKISPKLMTKIITKYPDTVEKNESITFSEYDVTTPSENDGLQRVEEIHETKWILSDEITEIIILDIFLVFYYKICKIWKIKIIKHISGLDKEKSTIFSGRRMKHLHLKTRSISIDAELHISKLMSKESIAIFEDLNVSHQNLFINTKANPEILYNLKRFMFYLTWEDIPGHLPPFIDIVVYMKDILEGVQYLHDNHIYHLNISPENILIVECLGRVSGIAKISGFEFSTHSHKRTVEHQKVGLEFLYR